MRKIPLIDYLKGYSIFTIVLYHLLLRQDLSPGIDTIISFGGTGVHTFIMLSGLGLFLSFLNKPVGIFEFIRRRMSSMYLPYIIVVFITALVGVLAPALPFKPSLYAFLGHVFLYKMFDNDIINSYGPHLWFISTIIQFYFAFYIIIELKKKTTERQFLLVGVLISVIWSILLIILNKANVRTWNSFFLQYLWEFMLGMVIAERVKTGRIKEVLSTRQYLLIGLSGIAIYGVLALKGGRIGRVFNDIPALIGYTALGIFVYKLSISFINRFFIFTGNFSFSLFLLHILINEMFLYLVRVLGGKPSLYWVLPGLLISYVFSFIYQDRINLVFKKLNI